MHRGFWDVYEVLRGVGGVVKGGGLGVLGWGGGVGGGTRTITRGGLLSGGGCCCSRGVGVGARTKVVKGRRVNRQGKSKRLAVKAKGKRQRSMVKVMQG